MKAQIKDLELQIDYLIGYSPSSHHWKHEYYIRQELLDQTLADENTPIEIVNKINRIQESLYNMRNKIKNQGYMQEADLELKHKILVNDKQNNKTYYI
jgi:hypothetical protein